VEPLEGRIRPYAWGSRTAIAALQGRSASAGPEAELWLGAHPDSPSLLPRPDGQISLLDLIAADPAALLGDAALERFGARLPFLLKLLAAEEPLSLQAHPGARHAEQAYAAGRPGYRDGNHKPELLVAVSDFDALCGFAEPTASARALAGLGVPALEPVVAALRAGDLRTAVATLLQWPDQERAELVAAVASAGRNTTDAAEAGALAAELAARYPADLGVVVALLLNRVLLRPGEAIWMPAGHLHAYLHGTGIEIMAASDNVLRGGLTPKSLDVPELLRVLRFEVLDDPVVPPVSVVQGVVTWSVPAPEFALYRVRVDGSTVVPALGPRIALCLAGDVRVDDGVAEVRLAAGEAALGAAAARPVSVTGRGELYLATTG
jgi:mannose-6-phosphate isomerase